MWPWAHAARCIGMARRAGILVGPLVVHIIARRMRTGLGANGRRIWMLRLVGRITSRRLIMLLLPNRIASGLGIKGLRGRSHWRRSSHGGCGPRWRQRRNGLRMSACGDANQQSQTKCRRFDQAPHTVFSSFDGMVCRMIIISLRYK